MRIHGVLLQLFRQSRTFRSVNCGKVVTRQFSVLSPVVSNHYRQFRRDWGHWGKRSHCSCFNWSSRPFTTYPALKADAEMVDITFITPDGTRHKTKGKIGDNLLDVVVNNNVDLDGFGACEGTLACSTCHVVFKQENFDKIKDEVTDEELDMLDLAYGLTETSRLGCQVTLTKELGGLEVEVPAGVNDQRS